MVGSPPVRRRVTLKSGMSSLFNDKPSPSAQLTVQRWSRHAVEGEWTTNATHADISPLVQVTEREGGGATVTWPLFPILLETQSCPPHSKDPRMSVWNGDEGEGKSLFFLPCFYPQWHSRFCGVSGALLISRQCHFALSLPGHPYAYKIPSSNPARLIPVLLIAGLGGLCEGFGQLLRRADEANYRWALLRLPRGTSDTYFIPI